ncbi:MAG: helicase C-terminal domain-containing protein [Eubacteriales bacterium]|nr:helicase C-terminal domain-containing protein [Eubacteriales bacterium]
MDKELSRIREIVRTRVISMVDKLRKERNLKEERKSAALILALLKALDGKQVDKLTAIPADVDRFLVNLAIGGPAICSYRLMKDESAAHELSEKFVNLFNKPESMAILDAVYPNEGFYYDSVARYCAAGNLQAVLDEYAFVLGETGATLGKRMQEGFVDTASIPIESRESFLDDKPKPRIRCHFAVGYYNAKISEQAVQRTENIRNSFNSPFRPFVLATTSIGQEGLDFHNYSRKVMHWNLPSNPIDLEQREGRINRYMCHAIRQLRDIVAERFSAS